MKSVLMLLFVKKVPEEYRLLAKGAYSHGKGTQHCRSTTCEVTPLDRFSSDAVMPPDQGRNCVGANGDWIATVGPAWKWELVNVYTHRRIPLPVILDFDATDDDLEFINADGHNIRLLKIAICQAPSAAGKYKDFFLIGIFHSVIAALHGSFSSWTVLQNQFNLFPY